MLAYGIKDVENRTWGTKYRGKILIHASSKKVPDNFLDDLPIEWNNEIVTAVYMGQFPDIDDLPLGAIVGYADMSGCTSELTDSLWDGGEGLFKFMCENVYVFDEPITGVKGKLGLWEYDLDENHLPPAHQAARQAVKLEGKTLTISLEKFYFEHCMENLGFITLPPTEALDNTLFDYNEQKVKNIDTLIVRLSDGTVKSYNLPEGVLIGVVPDGDDKPLMVSSLYAESIEMQMYDFHLGEEKTPL